MTPGHPKSVEALFVPASRSSSLPKVARAFFGGVLALIFGAFAVPAHAAENASPTDESSGNASSPFRNIGDLGAPALDRQGASLDLSVGAAMAFGGRSLETGAMKPSPPSLFLGISGTYAVLNWLELGALLSLSAVGNRCWGAVSDQGVCMESPENWTSVSEDFTSVTASFLAVANYEVFERFRLSGALSVGWAFFDPSPRVDLWGGISVGASVGFLWTPPMDHFALGVSLGWQFTPEAALHVLSLTPRIRYTF